MVGRQPDISEDQVASIDRVDEYVKQKATLSLASVLPVLFPVHSLIILPFYATYSGLLIVHSFSLWSSKKSHHFYQVLILLFFFGIHLFTFSCCIFLSTN
jgi:hypothetical protein